MDFSFNLPMVTSDLLDSHGDNYYVKQLYSPTEIPEKLMACKQMVARGDPFYIFDHFDTFYAVIENKNRDSAAMTSLMRSFDLLYLTVDRLGNQLAPFLAISEHPSNQDRNSQLNLTKMCMFLLVNVVRKIDANILRLQQLQQTNLQKKRGKNADTVDQYRDWEDKRVKFLIQLYNILQFPLEKLWSPPIVEENFVNLICDICYRTLEILHARSDNNRVVETIFQVFGTAIKRYQHAMNFPTKILQILRTVEHASISVANGINVLYEEYNISSIFSVLIKDIVESLTLDSADTVVSRNFSNFLTQLASVAPKLMIPHLSTLCDELLNCESYTLRNCILQIMGDAIVGELTSEELSDELKEARNEFLENLLMHVNDVSAHVRSKVMQIWHHLKEEEAVPLSFQLKVLCAGVERLEDRTSSVRKHAVQLIKAFLERNPFSAKLTLAELLKKHDEEVENMEKLTEELAEERKKAEEIDDQWNLIIPEILPFVETSLKENNAIGETQENYDDLVQRISKMLLEKNYKEAVVLVRRADHVAGNSDLRLSLRHEEQCAYYMALLKSYIFLANGCKDSNELLGTQIKTVQFLQDSIEFSKAVSRAMPKLLEMLLSKTNTDVYEAVDLFTTGYMFGIKGTEDGMRQMLYLVWSSDKEKRDAVSDAYKKILFTTDQTGRAHAIKVVQNLSTFLEGLEYGHYTALECLVREWVTNEDIDATIIQVLFERFTLKLEGTSENESRLALQLLIMCSCAKSSIASANLTIIESIGLGVRGRKDPRIYSSCLEFFINSIDQSVSSKFYKRYDSDSSVVIKITDMFLKFFFHPRLPEFDKIATVTLQFFYHMCQKPDVIAQNIIKDLLKKFQEFAMKLSEITATQQAKNQESPFSQIIPDSQVASSQMMASQFNRTQANATTQLKMPVFLLSRFVFLIGYMTLKEMIFLDIDVYNNMKFREELTQCEEKKKKTALSAVTPSRRQNLNMSAMESLKRLSGAASEPQQEPDEDLVGATAEDNIAELINHICEDVLLYGENSLVAKIFPYILEICKYPAKFRDTGLQQAATLTLIRFMCVSSRFCETYMPFLMNILNNTKNIKIKCNIVIGLSDLTFRFPNIIEPWTGHFYSTLHENNNELRLTAVKMLSHLILHEMIRVKGQIADLAMCIVDPHVEIKNITQQFFKEIANKSNILYNVLPDIISKLSSTAFNLEEEKYRTIMRYILSLIQKDRQVETLVEKLCLRFPVTREERQWRDIAFCLSLLSYNEKTIKKLIDNLQNYKDKVQNDDVYHSFKLIISNTSKLAKPELKTLVTELETRINQCLNVTEPGEQNQNEEHDKENSSASSQTKATKKSKGRPKPSSKQSKSTSRRTRRRDTSSEEESSDSSSDETAKRNTAKSNQARRKPISSDNESSDSDERPAPSKQNKKAPVSLTTSRRNKVIQESGTSDDEIPQRKRGRSNK